MLRLRRSLLLAAVVLILLAALSPRAWHLWTLVGADDWGSDWRWLADGLDRLSAGLPLNHPEYVSAPYSQLANGPAYTWSMHPPWNAALFSPTFLLAADLRQAGWTWLMAAALAAAAWLAWPRGLWWGSNLLLAVTVLAAPAAGLVDQIHFANPNALVVLGVVLVWRGRRRASLGLVVAGLLLAAIKITPALALAAWLLVARNGAALGRRGMLLAVLGVIALTIPVVLLDPGVIGDTIRVQMNLVPWDDPSNLAPQMLLARVVGMDAATLLSRATALGLIGLILVRRLDGPGGFLLAATAPLLLTPQLWLHWFLIPAAAVLLAAGDWPRFRVFDAWLRAAWTAPPGKPGVTEPVQAPHSEGPVEPEASPRVAGSPPVRAVFALIGTISLAVGIVGIVLPVLPTTPFLLFAAACYARASSRLHRWLMGQRTLGPIIERWQRSRSMAPGVKRRAMIVTVFTFAVSIILVGSPAPAVVLAATGAAVLAFLARIPTDD